MKTAPAHQGTVSILGQILALSPVSANHLLSTQVCMCLYHLMAKGEQQGLAYTRVLIFQMPSEYNPHPTGDGDTGKTETGLGNMNLPGSVSDQIWGYC